MNLALRKRLLLAVRTDRLAEPTEVGWQTRCIHCRAAVGVAEDGTPDRNTTLEHIVPRSWFEKRLPAELAAIVADPNEAKNLALACRRCNHGKGAGHDARGPGNARAREIVMALLQKRLERYRPEGEPGCDVSADSE